MISEKRMAVSLSQEGYFIVVPRDFECYSAALESSSFYVAFGSKQGAACKWPRALAIIGR
jgi:hypothetical protein